MTEERLQQFIDAWKRHDVDACMTFMAQDCVYEIATGPEPGRTYTGQESVRQIFAEFIADEVENHIDLECGPVLVCGDRGMVEWAYTDERGIRHRGCDLFRFSGDLVTWKSAFCKVLA